MGGGRGTGDAERRMLGKAQGHSGLAELPQFSVDTLWAAPGVPCSSPYKDRFRAWLPEIDHSLE